MQPTVMHICKKSFAQVYAQVFKLCTKMHFPSQNMHKYAFICAYMHLMLEHADA